MSSGASPHARTRRPSARQLDPSHFVLRRGLLGEQPYHRPRERALLEGLRDRRELAQLGSNARQALGLSRRESQALAAVITQASEAELVLAATAQEAMRETAEDQKHHAAGCASAPGGVEHCVSYVVSAF